MPTQEDLNTQLANYAYQADVNASAARLRAAYDAFAGVLSAELTTLNSRLGLANAAAAVIPNMERDLGLPSPQHRTEVPFETAFKAYVALAAVPGLSFNNSIMHGAMQVLLSVPFNVDSRIPRITT